MDSRETESATGPPSAERSRPNPFQFRLRTLLLLGVIVALFGSMTEVAGRAPWGAAVLALVALAIAARLHRLGLHGSKRLLWVGPIFLLLLTTLATVGRFDGTTLTGLFAMGVGGAIVASLLDAMMSWRSRSAPACHSPELAYAGVPKLSQEPLASVAGMDKPYRVVLPDFIVDALQPERKILGDLAEVTALGAHSEEELVGRIEQADAMVVFHEVSITRRTIERLQRCRVIARAGVGYDNIDYRFARERGIPVVNVPDYGSGEVADTAIGMMLTLARGVHVMNSRLRERRGPWLYQQVVPIARLSGRGFGVVGLGRIGTATALRAKALGMDVLFYDPYKPDGYDKALGVRRVETLDELLAESLVVSLHCPLGDETRQMIDAAAIARMPRGSYLVNTARGAIVDTRAIPDALASGHLAGAAIDVLPAEPPADDDPLLVAWRDPQHAAYDRLIVNPHAAFYSEEGLLEMRSKGAEACRRAILGLPLRNVVN